MISGLVGLDITDPRHPRSLGELVSQRPAHNIVIEGDVAYVTLDDGIFLADVSKDQPAWIRGQQLAIHPTLGLPAIRAHRLYVPLRGSGIAVVNVAQPESIRVERTIATKDEVSSLRFLGKALAATTPDGVLLLPPCASNTATACWPSE